jgi:hypothetical protein
MRYMLLIHGDESRWDTLSEAERASQYERYGDLQREMEEQGHYVSGDEIAAASSAKLVRVRDGESTVSDGPFSETSERFGGYFIWTATSTRRSRTRPRSRPPKAARSRSGRSSRALDPNVSAR